ncbi:hypothetical protein LP417_29350 [Polaromonas sp. P1-6]|nr:hypothetical protein LP417_29350 [Polaromonas sp. P1-6]
MGFDAKNEDQQRRHQRAAANARQTHHQANGKSGKYKGKFMHKPENVNAQHMKTNYTFVLPLCG